MALSKQQERDLEWLTETIKEHPDLHWAPAVFSLASIVKTLVEQNEELEHKLWELGSELINGA